MLQTEYALPFKCDVARDNPWNGVHEPQVWLEPATSSANLAVLAARWIAPFWSLASWGALVGPKGTPKVTALPPPRLELQGARVGFTFQSCVLDERASHVLLSAILAGSEEVALKRVRIGSAAQQLAPIEVVDRVREPYPTLPKKLPFRCVVEDSESDTRVLKLTPIDAFTQDRLDALRLRLEGWAGAVNQGTFGVSPASPSSCDCIPEDMELFEDEVSWPLSKCRFHPAAIDSLAAVCAALHDQAAFIGECWIE
jgi:hypothetical protein